MFAELLNAVEHMHSRGVTHRDLKPENILITQSGMIKYTVVDRYIISVNYLRTFFLLLLNVLYI